MTLGVRSEQVLVSTRPQPDAIEARVALVEPVGSDMFVSLLIGATPCVARTEPRSDLEEGQAVWLTFVPERLHLFDSAGRNVLAGDAVPVAVLPDMDRSQAERRIIDYLDEHDDRAVSLLQRPGAYPRALLARRGRWLSPGTLVARLRPELGQTSSRGSCRAGPRPDQPEPRRATSRARSFKDVFRDRRAYRYRTRRSMPSMVRWPIRSARPRARSTTLAIAAFDWR